MGKDKSKQKVELTFYIFYCLEVGLFTMLSNTNFCRSFRKSFKMDIKIIK